MITNRATIPATSHIISFVESKEMPSKKTVRHKRKDRRRTLKKIPGKKRRGGNRDSQALIPPTSAFGDKIGTPEPSNSIK
jgi:hypothetical protein